ncbi:MAG TPA: GDSL-type esterase/lipase family protein [Nocardioides sp.]|nr:GDSL-type esterase/lipase family protein [Nocardioides sp.]
MSRAVVARTAVWVGVLLAVATGGLTAGPLSASSAAASTVAPVTRVMLSGDSITQGFTGGNGSWRYWLWKEIARQGEADQVNFVGPFDYVGKPGTGGRYLHKDFDRDHAAAIGTTTTVQSTRIEQYVADYRPDILVVLLGHNDLADGATPEATANRMRTYIANARAAKPDLKIVLGEVLDAVHTDGSSTFDGANHVLNDYYAQIAKDLSTPDSPITIANTQYSGWDPRTMTWDGTHPTPRGETRIAQRIAWALRRPVIGLLHEDPQIGGNPQWEPNVRPAVTSPRRHHILVDWSADRQGVHGGLGVQRVEISVHRVGSTSTRRIGWTSDTTDAITHAVRGTYRIRVKARRHWMIGTWGPALSVTVR